MEMPALPPDPSPADRSITEQPPLANRNRRWLLVMVALWLLLMAGLLVYSLRLPENWFDPQQVQPHPFHDAQTLPRLLTALTPLHPELAQAGPLFIRFRQADCRCETLVDAYHQLQTPRLQQQGYTVLTLEQDELEKLQASAPAELFDWISATPAVLVVDRQGRLAYFGPYHQEGICNSENSYLEPVLKAVQSGQPVNIVNTLVFGCFCPTADQRSQ